MELANQRDILKRAFSVKKITHVAVSINSPGGSPVQSHLIYSYIRQLAEKNKVKVIVFAEDVAASGVILSLVQETKYTLTQVRLLAP